METHGALLTQPRVPIRSSAASGADPFERSLGCRSRIHAGSELRSFGPARVSRSLRFVSRAGASLLGDVWLEQFQFQDQGGIVIFGTPYTRLYSSGMFRGLGTPYPTQPSMAGTSHLAGPKVQKVVSHLSVAASHFVLEDGRRTSSFARGRTTRGVPRRGEVRSTSRGREM